MRRLGSQVRDCAPKTQRGTRPPVAQAAQLSSPPAAAPRERLVRHARLLAWSGLAWHLAEAAVAILAGAVAGSIALVGFGGDSLIEAVAGIVVLWLMSASRSGSASAERRAQQLIAASFVLLAAYVAVASIHDVAAGDEPGVSWIGIGLSAVTLLVMPPLAWAKRRVGEKLGSAATMSESRQTMLCAYLSGALMIGLGANAILTWWWADPLAALVIAGMAVSEARDAWQGDACECCAPSALSAHQPPRPELLQARSTSMPS